MWETREECSRNLRTFESEICSMKKIRTELYKVAGNVSFFQDCCVTEWEEAECSVSCGGGDVLMTREITAQPEGGMACPPLRAFKPCNERPCPIDCRLDVWQGWSACSAFCNGGVRQRMRQVEVEAQYDGVPCGETTESMSCNLQACDVDCTLGDWTDWTSCSKVCDWGHSERHRAVSTAAGGDGHCPTEYDPE